VYGADEGHFNCFQCLTCPDDYYTLSTCNTTHQTVCAKCSTCDDFLQAVPNTCTGIRDTTCLPAINAVSVNANAGVDIGNRIEFTASYVAGGNLTLHVSSPTLKLSADSVVFRRNFLNAKFQGAVIATPSTRGIHVLNVAVKGFYDCNCRPSSDPTQACQAGCTDADAAILSHTSLNVVAVDGDAIPVWERLNLRFGETPTAEQLGGLYQCDNSDVEITYRSSKSWSENGLTCGVVTLETQGVQIPVSVGGAQLNADGSFVSATDSEAALLECNEDPFFSNDVLDFVLSDAMPINLLELIDLPDWLSFNVTSTNGQLGQFLKSSTESIRGKDALKLSPCAGLPLRDSGIYQLMTMNRGVSMLIDNQPIEVDDFDSQGFCLLWDTCQPKTPSNTTCSGIPGTIFFGMNNALIRAMSTSQAGQALAKTGITGSAMRFGFGGYHIAFGGEEPTFWNGYQNFQHTEIDVYNAFVGGDFHYELTEDIRLDFTGNLFVEAPFVCGAFRDLMGTGSLAAAGEISGKLSFDFGSSGLGALKLIGILPQITFDAQALLSLGGDIVRDSCGFKSNPAGLFITGNANLEFPSDSVLGVLFPQNRLTSSFDADAFMLLRREANPLPSYAYEEIQYQMQQYTLALTQAVGVFQTDNQQAFLGVVSGLQGLIENMMQSGLSLNAEFAGDLARLTVQMTQFSKAAFDEIKALFERATDTFASNVQDVAAAWKAEVTDLYEGVGFRGRLAVCFGDQSCMGFGGEIEAELTFMRGDNFGRCDERFGDLYRDVFASYFTDVALAVGKTRSTLDSGHGKGQEGAKAFDGDVTTIWNGSTVDALLGLERLGDGPVVYVRSWAITRILSLRLYVDCERTDIACPHHVVLRRWKTGSIGGGWEAAAEVFINPNASKGWQYFDVDIPCIEQQGWSMLIKSVHVDRTPYDYTVFQVKYQPNVYVALHEVQLVGEGSKEMITGKLKIVDIGGFSLDPFGWISTSVGVSLQYFHSQYALASQARGDITNLETKGIHAAQGAAYFSLLGLNVEGGIILATDLKTRNGKISSFGGGSLTGYAVGDVWGIWEASIRSTMYFENDRQGINISGQFTTATREEISNTVHGFLGDIADEADQRFTQAQNGLTSAQNALSRGQDRLEAAKGVVDSKRYIFDDAVAALERAKQKVEAAKGPVYDAQDDLSGAQRKLDSLCKIKSCRDICMPGPIWVKKGWFGYPGWSSCAWKIKSPGCVLANAGCSLLRGAAWLILEGAKLFLYGVIAVLDAAKFVLTLAQGAVRVAELALDAAILVLTAAQGVLEGFKLALEGAKAVLEGVKIAVRFGLKLVAELVTFLINDIFKIRNAVFEVEMTNVNPFRIKIRFDVTIFRTIEINNIGFEFDFRDVASFFKRLAQSFVDVVKRAVSGGRRRRALEDMLANGDFNKAADEFTDIFAERMRRFAGDNATNSSSIDFDQLVEETEDPSTPEVDSCDCWSNVKRYLMATQEIVAAEALIAREMEQSMLTLANANASMTSAMQSSGSPSVDSNNAGLLALNISMEDLMAQYNASNGDAQLAQIMAQFMEATQAQMDAAVAAMQDRSWSAALVTQAINLTITCPAIDCSSPADCVPAALNWIGQELWSATANPCNGAQSNHSASTGCLGANVAADQAGVLAVLASSARIATRGVFSNTTSTAADADAAFADMRTLFDLEGRVNFFCVDAPVITLHPRNVTLQVGASVRLSCHAEADPAPEYVWTKNGIAIAQGPDARTILIADAATDDMGVYQCAAGNRGGTALSRKAYLDILAGQEELEVTVQATSTLQQGSTTSSTDEFVSLLANDVGYPINEVVDVQYNSDKTRVSMRFQPQTQAQASSVADLRSLLEESLRKLELGLWGESLRRPFNIQSWSINTVERASLQEDSPLRTVVTQVPTPAAGQLHGVTYEWVSNPEGLFIFDVPAKAVILGRAGGLTEARHLATLNMQWPAMRQTSTAYFNALRSTSIVASCMTTSALQSSRDEFLRGGLNCDSVLAPLAKALGKCAAASDADKFALHKACITQCGSAAQCGPTPGVCPAMAGINAIVEQVDPTALLKYNSQCVTSTINRLSTSGVCVGEALLACPVEELGQLEDSITTTSSCEAKQHYIRLARACRNKLRFNTTLYAEVAATCTSSCCVDAPVCSSTNTALIMSELAQNSRRCDATQGLLADVEACKADLIFDDSFLSTLTAAATTCLAAQELQETPTAILERIAVTLAEASAVNCTEQVVPFLMQTTKCLDPEYLTTSTAFHSLALTCIASCGAEACFGYDSERVIVQLEVTDVNDNAPAFTQDVYRFEINETAVQGTHLGMIQAVDRDVGNNALVNYTLTACVSEAGLTLTPCPIIVDSVSGIVTTSRSLLPYVLQTLTLTVVAADQGVPALSTSVALHVKVDDVNNNAPVLIVPAQVTLNEDVAANTVIAVVKATDQDSMDRGQLQYTITLGNDGSFAINASSGEVSVAGILDSSVALYYNLTVRVMDTAGQTASTVLYVVVRPMEVFRFLSPDSLESTFPLDFSFDSVSGLARYVLTIPENTAIATGTFLFRVAAGGVGAGEFGQGLARFTALTTSNAAVTVTESGIVRLASVELDFEKQAEFQVRVQAELTGPGVPASMAPVQAVIVLAIQNTNDHKPTIEAGVDAQLTVPQCAAVDTTVATYQAADLDGDDLVFSLEGAPTSLRVDNQGHLVVNGELAEGTFDFVLVVEDGAHRAELPLSVTVDPDCSAASAARSTTGMTAGAFAGIGVAVALGLVLLAVLIIFFVRRQTDRKAFKYEEGVSDAGRNVDMVSNPMFAAAAAKQKHASARQASARQATLKPDAMVMDYGMPLPLEEQASMQATALPGPAISYDNMGDNAQLDRLDTYATATTATIYDQGSAAPQATYDVGSAAAQATYDVGSAAPQATYDVGSAAPQATYDVGSAAAQATYDVGTAGSEMYDVATSAAQPQQPTYDLGSSLSDQPTYDVGNSDI
jgi:hypothetical protein